MKITNKIFREWKSFKEHGDFVKIAKKADLSVVTVQTSFKKQKCSPALYIAFKAFFDERKEEIKKIKAA